MFHNNKIFIYRKPKRFTQGTKLKSHKITVKSEDWCDVMYRLQITEYKYMEIFLTSNVICWTTKNVI